MYLIALISTLIIFVLSTALSVVISAAYVKKRSWNLLAWSSGLWLFAASVALEAIFAYAIYSSQLIDLYLFLVAVLVEFLALGSVLLVSNRNFTRAYAAYSIITDAFLVYSLASAQVGNIITSGVVFGPLPLLVIVASSLVTFPAAALLIIISALSYRERHNAGMISIIAGVVIVSIAGTLYIASFPSFLYYAEFIGILLLWIAFMYPFKKHGSA